MIRLDRAATLTVPGLNVLGNLPKSNELLAVLGWGKTPAGDNPDRLQLNDRLNFVRYVTCNDLWGGFLPPDIILCAGIGEEDTCRGTFLNSE